MRFLQIILVFSIIYGAYSIITNDISGLIWLIGASSFLFLSNKWMKK